ncbi:hypothetical protein [Caldimonas thermodepolymerans]|uniref:hypothetical protein n=1 Tax=Caldimonas thermodepolymerans TaxID=215580 RepID=UPI0022361836|nr:hypothetical protein [Caldimonas thermodepolymerans]UZG45641.1 hypothetical protein ONZ46_06730 [Caldimonas thermodepolymerans]
MQRTNSGKYLVLVGTPQAPRALLFGPRHDYLAELGDDEDVVEDLMKVGAPCRAPDALKRRVAHATGASETALALWCWRLADW